MNDPIYEGVMLKCAEYGIDRKLIPELYREVRARVYGRMKKSAAVSTQDILASLGGAGLGGLAGYGLTGGAGGAAVGTGLGGAAGYGGSQLADYLRRAQQRPHIAQPQQSPYIPPIAQPQQSPYLPPIAQPENVDKLFGFDTRASGKYPHPGTVSDEEIDKMRRDEEAIAAAEEERWMQSQMPPGVKLPPKG